MPNEVMRGATGLRKQIEVFLNEKVPPLIDVARDQWNLESWQLPVPTRYDAYDPLTVSSYPTVGSIVSRTSGWVRMDINEYAEEGYEADYAVRVFVWVRTPENDGTWESPEYDAAMRLRDDMLAIVRSCLLGNPSFGKPGIIKMDEKSLTEDYLDGIKANEQTNRWMVGGTLSFNVKLQEFNYLAKLGNANDVEVEARKLSL